MSEGEPSDVSRSVVALVRCPSYETRDVDGAVDRGIHLLGGIERFAAPGETLLLKPNLLAARDASRAVTTHPSVFRAVARRFAGAGAEVSYGDSPGFGRPATAARRAGLAPIAEELGLSPADFMHGRTVSVPEGDLI